MNAILLIIIAYSFVLIKMIYNYMEMAREHDELVNYNKRLMNYYEKENPNNVDSMIFDMNKKKINEIISRYH